MSNLFLNDCNIKTIKGLVNFFVDLKDESIEIKGDIYKIFKIFEIEDNTINPKEILDIIFKNKKSVRSISKYLSNNKGFIDIDRLISFIDYKLTNPNDSNSKKFLTLMYGETLGLEKFEHQKNKFSKYYDINYYLSQGLTEDEAKLKIQEYKNKKSTTLDNFIKKYGEIKGVEKYKEYVDKSKNTISNFKKRYGEQWEEKWINYTNKDSSSKSWALKKANGDTTLAENIFKEKIKKTTITLEFLIKKHGDVDGKLIWNEINSRKDASSINYYISKYSNYDDAIKLYKENNKKKDCGSLDFFIKSYGEEGLKKYEEKCKSSDNKSLDYFLKKFDNFDEAYSNYLEMQKKLKIKFLKASKASLSFFEPLYRYLIDNNIFNEKDIFLGINGINEYFIKTKTNIYFYDFAIKSKKIIIEYNGKAWHPNWEKYDIEDCIKNFTNKNIDVKKAIEKDKNKINTAIENGFNVLILWEEDSYETNQQKLKTFLKQNDINYEN
jgi:G:T-mismatch repair DNA endonuclease (very short patch repair protein)